MTDRIGALELQINALNAELQALKVGKPAPVPAVRDEGARVVPLLTERTDGLPSLKEMTRLYEIVKHLAPWPLDVRYDADPAASRFHFVFQVAREQKPHAPTKPKLCSQFLGGRLQELVARSQFNGLGYFHDHACSRGLCGWRHLLHAGQQCARSHMGNWRQRACRPPRRPNRVASRPDRRCGCNSPAFVSGKADGGAVAGEDLRRLNCFALGCGRYSSAAAASSKAKVGDMVRRIAGKV
jgi:hypothetical protein